MKEQSKEFSIFMYKYMDKMNLGSVGKTAAEYGVSRQQFYKWLNGGIPNYEQLRTICSRVSKNTGIQRAVIVAELVQILHNIINQEK